ncbi:hypothetical protein [Novosphingobium sp.]|uniref:hypothetical protein n=1 Tax=Novosphingobium sp. TaxID=1874826 RepID=UPI0026088E07|nr:hypothetical protein [Novosphingobium sp.]
MAEFFDSTRSAPISLYFDIEKGRRADLSVVAEAAIAWAQTVREIIDNLEPGLEIRIEIVDGEQGSLWINTLVKIEKFLEAVEKGGKRYPHIWALVRGFAIIVVATPLSVTAEDIWKSLVGEKPELVKLSDEDKRKIVNDLAKALRENVAPKPKQRFYKAVLSDPVIKGVGVASDTKRRPELVASRNQIELVIRSDQVDDEPTTRRRTEELDVVLVSPVLRNAERSWRFLRPGLPEFGAVMKDRGFLDALVRGGIHVELREGISMKVEIEYKERREGNLWITEDRAVLRVIEPNYDRGGLSF